MPLVLSDFIPLPRYADSYKKRQAVLDHCQELAEAGAVIEVGKRLHVNPPLVDQTLVKIGQARAASKGAK